MLRKSYNEKIKVLTNDVLSKSRSISENNIVFRLTNNFSYEKQEQGSKENYDLCIDSEIGNNETADIICKYIKSRTK